MIKDIFVWCFKSCLQGIFWVLILSISLKGKTLFDRGHDIFVDNKVVSYLNEQVEEFIEKTEKIIKTSISQLTKNKDESEEVF